MARNDKIPQSSGLSPQDALYLGLNMVTETLPRAAVTGANAFATGDIRAAVAPIRAGDVISTLSTFVVVAGTAVTLFQGVVYDRNFGLVGSTADVKASLSVSTWLNASLSTPWTSTYDGVVYLGWLCTFTTTSPQVPMGNTTLNAAFTGPFAGNTGRIGFAQAGLGAPPNVATPGSIGAVYYTMAS